MPRPAAIPGFAARLRHVQRRLRERYGLTITGFEFRTLGLAIEARDARRARYMAPDKRYPHKSVWLVRHRDRWVVAVYDARTATVATVLPLDQQFADEAPQENQGTPPHDHE